MNTRRRIDWRRGLAGGALALSGLACVALEAPPPRLATASTVGDFDSYRLRRVGLLPFRGASGDRVRARSLQQAFASELAATAPFEIVALSSADVVEIGASDPLRRGAYDPRDVLELSRRFRLDGLLVGTVTELQPYTPQALALEIELVAAETGLPIWSAQIALDASDARLRRELEQWHSSAGEGEPADAQVGWLSPERLARFAACAIAATL